MTGPVGCRCSECFGLAEYMLALTGSDHGLPRARGHLALVPERKPEPPAVINRNPDPQPWVPRPARRRTA